VSHAWVDPGDAGLAGELGDQLADLGYVVAPARGLPAAPLPALIIVTAGAETLAAAAVRCAAWRALEDLDRVPLLLAVRAPALRAGVVLPPCDELLVAPWSPEELRVRVDRAERLRGVTDADDVVGVGSLELNLATHQARLADTAVDFTYMEYELLRFLMTHPNRVFSRDALLSRVWGYDFNGGTRTVDVHVRRVRSKLGGHAYRLQTVRGVGYCFER
jgi:DNA-binding response OmpR family regulator